MWCLTVVASATAYSDEVQATATTATTKKTQHSSSMRIAPRQVDCISVIYNTFIHVHWGITINY